MIGRTAFCYPMKDTLSFYIFCTLLFALSSFNRGIATPNDELIKITAKEGLDIEDYQKPPEVEWKMRYFPEKLNVSRSGPRSMFADHDDMISVDSHCDDGRTNLIIDWDESMTENYTCIGDTISSDVTIAPHIRGAFIPPEFSAPHFCMNSKIDYAEPLITFGAHRPLWGRYGEYKFIPPQRWLHNAEHGAVVMLYHPCADPKQVNILRKLVTSCLYRHIITPYNLLPEERPLALVTWGWYLGMNVVRPKLAQRFILEHALEAPEDLELDGEYDYMLSKPAKIVSDRRDSTLCISYM